jgi:hypothetical protein
VQPAPVAGSVCKQDPELCTGVHYTDDAGGAGQEIRTRASPGLRAGGTRGGGRHMGILSDREGGRFARSRPEPGSRHCVLSVPGRRQREVRITSITQRGFHHFMESGYGRYARDSREFENKSAQAVGNSKSCDICINVRDCALERTASTCARSSFCSSS